MPLTILILGGSFTAISVAHYILKHTVPALPNPENYEVVLVSSSRELLVRPATPRALIDDKFFDQGKLVTSLEEKFKDYDEKQFKFIHGRAKWLDHEQKTVTIDQITTNGTNEIQIPYHALVLGTGSSTPSPLFSLNSTGASELRKTWAKFRSALPSAKSIVIAGGGPVGIETAGELGEHLNGRGGWMSWKSASPKVKITVVTSADKVLPELRESIARTAEEYLSRVGVEVVKGVRVEGVEPENAGRVDVASKTKVKLSTGEVLDADLYIPAYGVTPNSGFVHASLKAEDGRVKTNKQTLRVDEAGPRVYAAGDVSDYYRPAIHILTEAIPVVCANLKRDLLVDADQAVTGDDRIFKGDDTETHLVPIGQSKGVGAAKGWRIPSFMVWLIKGRDYWVGMTQGTWSGKAWAKET